ncbi:Inositol polyphosphate kinase [Moelleriella libera RCEF 2490]|uniref:Kinase n=1 Tax=Moelleriella libera RCEF 2490 TaxID=1081109 RepID=A0A168BIM9_9HYPO|nr:Inositol polyphosphate kinase [Moelleriella libera RCEF 2490]
MSHIKCVPINGIRSYDHAVAGHAGTLCDSNGELFIKPCTQAEIDFYEAANEPGSGRHEMSYIMPLYMGKLALTHLEDGYDNTAAGIMTGHDNYRLNMEEIQKTLLNQMANCPDEKPTTTMTTAAAAASGNGKAASSKTKAASGKGKAASAKGKAASAKVKTASVKETEARAQGKEANDSTKGNKLKTDMAVVLENLTHGYKRPNVLDIKLGVRLWADDATQEKKERFDKITAETTHGSLGFRIAGMRVWRGSDNPAELDEEGYKTYDKDYGRKFVNADNISDAIQKFVFNEPAGIDEEMGKAICKAIRESMSFIRERISRHEVRMYSSSFLIVYEGDGEAIREAIETHNRYAEESAHGLPDGGPDASRIDSGIDLEDEESDGEESDMTLPMIWTLKLIDFAHAAWTPGLGPDENVLKGVRNLERIFKKLGS